MNEKVVDFLLTQGLLGIIALILMWVVLRLYSDREKERAAHKLELRNFEDRYISKAETWMEKYHELAKSLNTVLESITRRRGNDSR